MTNPNTPPTQELPGARPEREPGRYDIHERAARAQSRAQAMIDFMQEQIRAREADIKTTREQLAAAGPSATNTKELQTRIQQLEGECRVWITNRDQLGRAYEEAMRGFRQLKPVEEDAEMLDRVDRVLADFQARMQGPAGENRRLVAFLDAGAQQNRVAYDRFVAMHRQGSITLEQLENRTSITVAHLTRYIESLTPTLPMRDESIDWLMRLYDQRLKIALESVTRRPTNVAVERARTYVDKEIKHCMLQITNGGLALSQACMDRLQSRVQYLTQVRTHLSGMKTIPTAPAPAPAAAPAVTPAAPTGPAPAPTGAPVVKAAPSAGPTPAPAPAPVGPTSAPPVRPAAAPEPSDKLSTTQEFLSTQQAVQDFMAEVRGNGTPDRDFAQSLLRLIGDNFKMYRVLRSRNEGKPTLGDDQARVWEQKVNALLSTTKNYKNFKLTFNSDPKADPPFKFEAPAAAAKGPAPAPRGPERAPELSDDSKLIRQKIEAVERSIGGLQEGTDFALGELNKALQTVLPNRDQEILASVDDLLREPNTRLAERGKRIAFNRRNHTFAVEDVPAAPRAPEAEPPLPARMLVLQNSNNQLPVPASMAFTILPPGNARSARIEAGKANMDVDGGRLQINPNRSFRATEFAVGTYVLTTDSGKRMEIIVEPRLPPVLPVINEAGKPAVESRLPIPRGVDFEITPPKGSTMQVAAENGEVKVEGGAITVRPDRTIRVTEYASGRYKIKTKGGQSMEILVEPRLSARFDRIKPGNTVQQLPIPRGIDYKIRVPGGTVAIAPNTTFANGFEIKPDGKIKAPAGSEGKYVIETAGGQSIEFHVEADMSPINRIKPNSNGRLPIPAGVEFSIRSSGARAGEMARDSVPVRGKETVAAGSFEISPDGTYKATPNAGGKFQIETAGGQKVEFHVEADLPAINRIDPPKQGKLPIPAGVEFKIRAPGGMVAVAPDGVPFNNGFEIKPDGSYKAPAGSDGAYRIETVGGQRIEFHVEKTLPPKVTVKPGTAAARTSGTLPIDVSVGFSIDPPNSPMQTIRPLEGSETVDGGAVRIKLNRTFEVTQFALGNYKIKTDGGQTMVLEVKP